MTPLQSERLIAPNFSWPQAEGIAKTDPEARAEHGPTHLDPQSGLILRPKHST
jgi:hypothetical protein